MKHLVVLLLFFASTSVTAAEYSESSFSNKMHSAYASLGFDQGGGLAIGGDYEYAFDRTFGLGGLLRMHSKDEDANFSGQMIIGGFIRPHFHRRAWDLYLSMGAAMINIDNWNPNGDDASGLGPLYGIGLLYQITDSISAGMEQNTYIPWFGGDDFQGVQFTETMARVRFQF